MTSFVLCGMQFGDEGKGSFVDYLAHENNIDCVVRYNGGAQASHTVTTPSSMVHKFSQLGSGMFLDQCHTYLTENMVVNLDSLMVELEVFSKKTGIPFSNLIDRIHIHENCLVVTPYHKLINQLRELAKGKNRRGTVGTGVSEVRYVLSQTKDSTNLGLQVKDIFYPNDEFLVQVRLLALYQYASKFYKEHKEAIWKNMPEELKEDVSKRIKMLLQPDSVAMIADYYVSTFQKAPPWINLKRCIYSTYELSFRKNFKSAIFEGSQGLLIDGKYGIKPNTTFLDTTNHFALNLSSYTDDVNKIGIAKAFVSRHGMGIFPSESEEVSSKISDENQEETFWNGKIRFGWFDAVLLRYAQKINHVDELYLSSIDQLDTFKTIRVCNGYQYHGVIDKRFEELFDYETFICGHVVIRNIKENGEDLGMYLEQATPVYTTVEGWLSDTSHVSHQSDLPEKCLAYIKLIETLTNLPVTVVSVGPTRENKIRLMA